MFLRDDFFHLGLQEYTSHTGQFWYGETVCSGADSVSSQRSLLHCMTNFISPPFIYSTHVRGETGACQFLCQALRTQRWMLNETKLLISFKETRCTDRCTDQTLRRYRTHQACVHACACVWEREREKSCWQMEAVCAKNRCDAAPAVLFREVGTSGLTEVAWAEGF